MTSKRSLVRAQYRPPFFLRQFVQYRDYGSALLGNVYHSFEVLVFWCILLLIRVVRVYVLLDGDETQSGEKGGGAMNIILNATAAEDILAKGLFDIVLALLNWPFLLFIGIAIFIWYFRDRVGELFQRGDIQISWGENRHIKLTDISEGIDEELDPLREEIQSLKGRLIDLETQCNAGAVAPQVVVEEELDGLEMQAAKERLMQELLNGRYRWRAVETLAKKAAISEKETLNILRKSTKDVILSMGKSGRQIARHKDR